jgi:hypothetical protein
MDDPEYQTMRNGDEFTNNREGYRYALAYLRANPSHLFSMLPTKLFWLYHTDTSGFYEGALYPPMQGPSPVADWIDQHQASVESVTFRYYEGVMALGIIGALLTLFQTRHDWIVPILAVPLLLTFFHFFFHAKDRFHMPLAAVIALLAAVAITEIVHLAVRWANGIRRQAPAMISG